MKQLTELRDLQRVQTKILKDLVDFCDVNNLKVYLLGGTMIGAIRHKGFIPWDDDIDVSMPRPDYEKLIELSKDGISEDCYLIAPELDKSFRGYIPQVAYRNSKSKSGQYRDDEDLKISISLFVYNGVPRTAFSRWIYYKYMYLLRAAHSLCRANFNNVNTRMAKIVGPILQPFFSSNKTIKYCNKILKLETMFSYNNTELVAPNSDDRGYKELVTREEYEKPFKVEFEGLRCYVPSNYDEHLRKYYGDYMQLPPERERTPKHSFEAWVEDDSLEDR